MQPEPTVAGAFRTTHWTVVLEASRADSQHSQEAFASLYLQYWYPLYAYVRRRGYQPAEAEDITQDFFTRLLSHESLAGLQRAGGKFRSFLLKTLENFLANEWDRAHAQKRGGGQPPLSLNVEQGEARFALDAPDADTPASLFEKRWAFTLLERVMARLQTEYVEADKHSLFDQLRSHLQGDRSGPAYAVIAAQCGLSEGAVKVAAHRMRYRYGELLREEIARTVSSSEEVDEELRYLIRVIGG
jgi:RNA polymerase sigma-70 factor (ECF subfamily)